MDGLPKRWRQVAMPGSSLVVGEVTQHWVHDQMGASSRHMRSSQEWEWGVWGSQEPGSGCTQGPGSQQHRPDTLLRGFWLIFHLQEEGGCDRKVGINLLARSQSPVCSAILMQTSAGRFPGCRKTCVFHPNTRS